MRTVAAVTLLHILIAKRAKGEDEIGYSCPPQPLLLFREVGCFPPVWRSARAWTAAACSAAAAVLAPPVGVLTGMKKHSKTLGSLSPVSSK